MDGTDRELGWEDVGRLGGASGGAPGSALGGSMEGHVGDSGFGEVPGISDAVTSAMVNHFAKEFSKGSASLLPQFLSTARRYFNVSHGYILRKCLWQLVPANSMKKKAEGGELGVEKDWTVRIFNGLEVEIEEPDLYIPIMGFVTYVLLCGLIRGLQDTFHPDVISATITFAMVALVVETTVAKAVLFTAGAVNTPAVDLAALLGYKFFYLSLHIFFGLILGWGHKPTGFVFNLLALGLAIGCGVALWQALRRLARMQPSMGQECVSDVHKLVVKGFPFGQLLVYWCLLPSWPAARQAAAAVVAVAEAVATTVVPALVAVAASASNASEVGAS
mmetsp:Transcript_78239/g.198860  ORF Transcript_78239/g.198860 Transcript_78239/m.198860 type:complete len:333 (-) Transcript_78239:147-1145(-)